MPLVRIAYLAGTPESTAAALSRGVHQALMEAFHVPEDDFFQVITEHTAGTGMAGPDSFLGITHTANLVMIQITCARGRSVEQKKALYARIAELLATNAGVRREDVIINLVETDRENWSFGNGVAQYAQ